MKFLSLKLLADKASQTLSRFPLVLLSAFLLTGLAIYAIEENPQDTLIFRLMQTASLGIPLFFALILYNERSANPQKNLWIYQSGATALLLIYFFTLPEELTIVNFDRYALYIISTHLFVAFAPYLHRNEKNGFWQYNQELFLRILLSGLYSFVLFAGIAIALLSIDQLFNAEIHWKRYSELWVIIVGIFNTWFFLSGVPKDFEELEKYPFYPRGLKIFTQFVLLPLVTLYLLILYSYTGKILFEWSLPIGWVTYLVISFSVAGIFSLLLIHPIREEEGNTWIKTFAKWFYRALFPLIILLFVAIGRRVWDYGITEHRYFIILVAFWLAGISLYFLLSKIKDIQYIPISLCIILLLASFGPWGAFYVSERSQINRLGNILERNELLRQGKIVRAEVKKRISEEDTQEIAAITDYLSERESLGSLQPYFKENLDSLLKSEESMYGKKQKVLALMGEQIASSTGADPEAYKNEIYFSVVNETANIKNIKGYDFMLDLNEYSTGAKDNTAKRYSNDEVSLLIKIDYQKNKLSVSDKRNNRNLMDFDLNPLIARLIEKYEKKNYDIPPADMTLLEEGNNYRAKLLVRSIGLTKTGKKKGDVKNLSATLLLSF